MTSNSLQVFQSYADAWNRHDADGIVATFVDGGTYSDPTTPGPLTGAAIGAYASGLWGAFPDLSFEMERVMEGDGGVLSAEWVMRGVNSGSMMGLPPTGRAVEVRGVDIAVVEDGRLRHHVYLRARQAGRDGDTREQPEDLAGGARDSGVHQLGNGDGGRPDD